VGCLAAVQGRKKRGKINPDDLVKSRHSGGNRSPENF